MNENYLNFIVQDERLQYNHYVSLVNKYLETDWREIIIQNRVITPLLEKLFINEKDISIVDISTQNDRQNSKIHDTRNYRNEGAASPDLLVARHWNYANIKNANINYLAVVEVKSPILNPIFNKDSNVSKIKKNIKSHLNANDKVILTDCIKWVFFNKGNGCDPVKTINLYNENNNGVWKIVNNPKLPLDNFEPTYENEPKEWNELCGYMHEFIFKN